MKKEGGALTKPDVQEAIEILDAAMRTSGLTREMMQTPEVVDALAVVGCDIGARPQDAPVFDDLNAHIVSVRREPSRLTVEFAASAADLVAGFVAAEQKCCSDLAFSATRGDPTVMRIEARPDLIDAVEGWMTPAS